MKTLFYKNVPCNIFISLCIKNKTQSTVNTQIWAFMINWLNEWLIDWLIVCCFSSRSRIFHSHRESPFPVKGRSKFTLKAHTVPIKLCINQARHLKMFSICHPQAGWLLWKGSSHFKVLLKPDYNSITYVQSNGYDLFVVSHTYMPGFTQDFIVHMIYKFSCCLQARRTL